MLTKQNNNFASSSLQHNNDKTLLALLRRQETAGGLFFGKPKTDLNTPLSPDGASPSGQTSAEKAFHCVLHTSVLQFSPPGFPPSIQKRRHRPSPPRRDPDS